MFDGSLVDEQCVKYPQSLASVVQMVLGGHGPNIQNQIEKILQKLKQLVYPYFKF